MHLNMWIWIEVLVLAIDMMRTPLKGAMWMHFQIPLSCLVDRRSQRSLGEWEKNFHLFNRFGFSPKLREIHAMIYSSVHLSVVKKMPPHFCESLLSDGWLCWKIRKGGPSSYSHIPSSHSEWKAALSFLKKHNRFTVSSLRPCFLLVS